MEKIVFEKSDIRDFVKTTIAEKIEKLKNFIEFTLEASRDIKKTPKYDSMREEMQEEIYQMQRQLGALNDLKRNMAKVLNTATERVQLGSLVITNKARFYISVSLGEFFFEGDRFYAISPESPMAKKMMGMKAGDEFTLNKIHQKIIEIL
ncbi:transcription elongation GreA/GreB family factor [Chryseobacterium bernardetii]|jgi:transcription elongation GreA/GreB family factor|uniref:GreA/GreB family transcription elongation factor n=2 Tax=Chryseobacterium TaxID=59732 RepID=A0A543EMV8_9FLAO|nr:MULTISPECIES: GreA/GreB family elongation factor [Chryseobacterium]MDR6369306.1 transcription elongation GreA/GreB family factor [Chryseobacterium vietnamense]MDR6439772.1 transcription elongation GreA/GreB family factor [Chryseobacterium bernardetii]MDR6487611.1 transcription elongation GreA/GreB family factor [Chryseobacterium vietnamense]TQM22907.1 GreA/GreB family transcription elongation factor [Chryseobacterium aquifrigidense]